MYGLILFLHVVSGSTALLCGLAALLVKKGSLLHRRSGTLFFYSMLLVGSSSMVLSVLKPSSFFFHIGFFSLFMSWSGYRALHNKTRRANWRDKVFILLSAANTVVMFASGQVLLLFFGLLSALLLYGERTLLMNKIQSGKDALLRHVRMMVGSYISTLTAFLVVNIKMEPGYPFWLPWVAPSILFVPFIIYHSRKIEGKLSVLTLLFLLSTVPISAQPYLDEKSRHRFAQLNIGSDTRLFSKNHAQQSVIIGGTHFWGHADFYIAIPILSSSNNFKAGVESGFRFYPKRLASGKLRPYGGFALTAIAYEKGDGPFIQRFASPLLAGVSYLQKRHMFDLGASVNFQNQLLYPTDRNNFSRIHTPLLGLSVGYKFMIETTLSAEKNWKSGATLRLTDTLAVLGRLNGITLSAGFSSAFFTHPSPDNPTFCKQYPGIVFPEVALGYYLHTPDIQFNLLWRSMKTGNRAYGFVQEVKREALSFETFKFLFDYHGFVPFAGPALSYETMRASERDGQDEAKGFKQSLQWGLIMGWDIRPNRLQFFYLRTSIRYFPRLSISLDNQRNLRLDTLEINFIQLVLLPGRMF